METTSRIRFLVLAAVAPIAWGSTYWVTQTWLPAGRPLFAAAARALPAGLALLAVLLIRRGRAALPHGAWWWRAALLGLCNIGLFFPLIFLAAYHLPGGIAATVQAGSPLVVMLIARLLIGEHATGRRIIASLVGVGGVALLVWQAPAGVSPLGLAAAVGSVVVSGLGFVLIKRWDPPVDMVTLVSWQLVAAGLVLVPVALLVEGAPPALTLGNLGGLLWIGGVGTVLAYVCWFTALRELPASSVSLVGLLNPVVGTALGAVLAGEAFGLPQLLGMVLVVGGVVAGNLVRRQPPTSSGRSPAERATASGSPQAASQLANIR